MSEEKATVNVTIWVDPTCGYTWRTASWLRAVAAGRGEAVRWRLLSLAILNEHRDVPEQYREGHRRSRLASRVVVAADAAHGNDAVAALYAELGARVHERGAPLDRATVEESLAAAGLPASLADAWDDDSWDDAVRASHEEGQARVGQESGSPVVAFADAAGFFGPILTAVPTGAEAEKLYDAFAALSSIAHFSELKRARI